MRLRRKGSADETSTAPEAVEDADQQEGAALDGGPWDVDEVPEGDDVGRVDLGSILVAPLPDAELRIQVDDESGEVRAVLLATEGSAVELRAFAAPRNGDLWGEVRPQIAADHERRGGSAVERDGRYGPELLCEVAVTRPDGVTGTQVSRVVGVNGPRWLLRATFLGEAANDPTAIDTWDDVLAAVVVRRGNQAMLEGEQLPLRLPEGAQPRPVD